METDFTKKLIILGRKYWLPLVLALSSLIFFVYGLIAFWETNSQKNQIKFESSSSAENSSENTLSASNLLVIDIEGEVAKPGVYKLKQGSIVQDALVASGGLTALADRDLIAKNLNLALKLVDSQKIYIPKIGDNISQATNSSPRGEAGNNQTSSINQSSLININTASESDLDSLPGVGVVTAEKIISNRPYAVTNDLVAKKSVSQKVFDQIKDKIVAQ